MPNPIPVLMYHRISPSPKGDALCLTPERFRAQMRTLARAGYRAIPLRRFLAWMRGETSLGDRCLLITFDDGYQGVLDYAAPVLAALGWPATLFLVAARLGGRSDWEHPSGGHPLLDKKGVRTLLDQGFAIQSHGLTHAPLTDLDDQALARELKDSRLHLEDLSGQSVDSIAYPYGKTNARVQAMVEIAGYRWGFGVRSGFNRPETEPLDIRRLDIQTSDAPARLLRKVRFGTNDGRFRTTLRYYGHRLKQDLLGG